MTFLTRLDRPKLWDGYPFLLSAAIGDIEDDLILFISGYNDADILTGSIQSSTASEYMDSVIHFNINEIYGSLSGISYLNVYLESALGEVLTDTLRIDVVSPCDNPVYLIGRNSLGGSISWMFDTTQEYTFDYSNERKAKRLGLTSVNLSINEWEALHDYVTLGHVYRNNILEFTSSTIKTSTRIGQQVYDVDTDGNKTGILAIPTKNKTKTRQIKSIFELDIEYPEIFAY